MKVHRRKFLWMSGGALGGLSLARCGSPELTPDLGEFRALECPRLKVAQVQDLEAGQLFDFDYPETGVECFIAKLEVPAEAGVGPDSDIVAYCYRCTHMGCSLRDAYDHQNKVMGPCSCHFTTFSLAHKGLVVLGQATQDLVRVELVIEDGWIVATGMQDVVYGELLPRCEALA